MRIEIAGCVMLSCVAADRKLPSRTTHTRVSSCARVNRMIKLDYGICSIYFIIIFMRAMKYCNA